MDSINVSSIVDSTFHIFERNSSYVISGVYDIQLVDAAWILPASIIFFTMQSGLALIEAGIVSKKNEVNVMMKKFADICVVGIAYWIFGFAFMYGRGKFTTPFFGLGDFFVNAEKDDELSAQIFTFFFIQISFASTATTIASGGAGERFKFSAYLIYCFFSCLIYSIGANWIWAESGWLKNLGVMDFAGSGPIHIIGGAGAFVLCIVAAVLCFTISPLIDNMRIDDAVGATSVHLVGGIWGQISVGLFADPISGYKGLFYGGSYYLLLIQTLSSLSLTFWAAIMTLIILWCVNKIIPIRLDSEDEIIGCDLTEHTDFEDISQPLKVPSTSTVMSSMPQKFICPCQATHSGIIDDNLGKRRVFYINKSYEH